MLLQRSPIIFSTLELARTHLAGVVRLAIMLKFENLNLQIKYIGFEKVYRKFNSNASLSRLVKL